MIQITDQLRVLEKFQLQTRKNMLHSDFGCYKFLLFDT